MLGVTLEVPPDTTVQIVGGTQALARARVVELDSGDDPGRRLSARSSRSR